MGFTRTRTSSVPLFMKFVISMMALYFFLLYILNTAFS
jgi:hypothetical protein